MKNIKYKLTDSNMKTYGGFQWLIGEWYKATGSKKQELCSDGWLHCYDSPELAVLHNPIHANIQNPLLFEVEVSGASKSDGGMKCGYRKMRLVREIPLPVFTINQRIAYGILCALAVYRDSDFIMWANGWLSGKNRTTQKAKVTREAARQATWDATSPQETAAASSAWEVAAAAAGATREAARQAAWEVTWEAGAAAWEAAVASQEAMRAAGAATRVAWAAAVSMPVDHITLALRALKTK